MDHGNDKPIRDAADEVKALAADARAMLAEVKQGWLWSLLTIPPRPKVNGSNHQPSTTDAL